MVTQIEAMKHREERIAELIEAVRRNSHTFKKPKLIVIGGYALRAYIPFARYSRDCDFALPLGKKSNLDKVVQWFPELTVEAKEKKGSFGYLRLFELIQAGKQKIKVSFDFMEGEIRGRSEEGIILDAPFFSDSVESKVTIGSKLISIRVPSYQDFFIVKLFSTRPIDIRDIVAMVWKRGVPEPESFMKRVSQVVSKPASLTDKLDRAIKDVSDPRFVHSWRGTFITEAFTEADKKHVLRELRALKERVI